MSLLSVQTYGTRWSCAVSGGGGERGLLNAQLADSVQTLLNTAGAPKSVHPETLPDMLAFVADVAKTNPALLTELLWQLLKLPESRLPFAKYGGNTTCLRIYSDALPRDSALLVDAGSGFGPAAMDIIRAGQTRVAHILYTHYHHDHTHGQPLAPITHMPNIRKEHIGPMDQSFWPEQVFRQLLFRRPGFPVPAEQLLHHHEFRWLKKPETTVIVFHPLLGRYEMSINEYRRIQQSDSKITLPMQGVFPLSECLIITGMRANHSDLTMSYRFQDGPSGKSFVFATDHENTDAIGNDLCTHFKNADLAIVDAQYTTAEYQKWKGGWGHGTPEYAVDLSYRSGVRRVGLTHHDPGSSDAELDRRLISAQQYAREQAAKYTDAQLEVFSCSDYLRYDA